MGLAVGVGLAVGDEVTLGVAVAGVDDALGDSDADALGDSDAAAPEEDWLGVGVTGPGPDRNGPKAGHSG